LFKGKKNGSLSQLIALAVQARIQCWLVLRLPGGLLGEWGELYHHTWALLTSIVVGNQNSAGQLALGGPA